MQEISDPKVAQQIKLAIGKLDSLSILPCVAVQFYSKLLQVQFSPSTLTEIIETEPALCIRILSLAQRQGINLSTQRYSIRRLLEKLPPDLVRDTLLSVNISFISDSEPIEDWRMVLPKKELILHSIAVACCAKDIADCLSPNVEPQLAYLSGLLHDIGKFVLQDVMPKGYARIVEQAKSTKVCLCTAEQKHLATNHMIIGKNLSQRWHLPDEIGYAIWLHHTDTKLISQNVPQARMSQIVRSADSIVRQIGLGQSGSYDTPESAIEIAELLGIDLDRLKQISHNLPATVKKKADVLSLNLPNPTVRYCQVAQNASTQFARKFTELSLENRQLQVTSSYLGFITDFLLKVDSGTTPIEIAENFALFWQKFYQTGKVCIYLVPFSGSKSLEAVVIESLGQSRTVTLDVPLDFEVIPEAIARNFTIVDAYDYIDWLFEQLGVDFDAGRTKLMPLLSSSGAVGAIAFEPHYPADLQLFQEKFKTITSIVATIFEMTFTREKQEHLAEQIIQLIPQPAKGKLDKVQGSALPAEGGPQSQDATESMLDSLAELAAGVAHELNNPLSVISGRAQLLAKAETTQARQHALKQIQENAHEVSVIINDLMSYAKPPQPRPKLTEVKQVLDEAIQLTSQKIKIEDIDIQVDIADNVKPIFVDSALIASAIANIIANAIESYGDEPGPVKIVIDTPVSSVEDRNVGRLVRFQISDSGCGMDAETLRKATYPFFSAKPAGRKRGMGLAFAQRFIQLNKGSLKITSQPDSGTTVTIVLQQR